MWLLSHEQHIIITLIIPKIRDKNIYALTIPHAFFFIFKTYIFKIDSNWKELFCKVFPHECCWYFQCMVFLNFRYHMLLMYPEAPWLAPSYWLFAALSRKSALSLASSVNPKDPTSNLVFIQHLVTLWNISGYWIFIIFNLRGRHEAKMSICKTFWKKER